PRGGKTRILLDTPFPVSNGQQYSFIFEGTTDPYYDGGGGGPYTEGEALFGYADGFSADLQFSVEFIGPTTWTFTAEGAYPLDLYAIDDWGNVSPACQATFTLDRSLPVVLRDFSGQIDGKTNILSWSVDQEDNFSHYALERRTDANWVPLAMVPGTGATGYSYRDIQPYPTTYYRLKMVDLDETFAYSQVVYLEQDLGAAAGAMSVFPNPNTGDFTVRLPLTDHPLQLELRDLAGRSVLRAKTTARSWQAGERLGRGVYLVTATDGRQRWTQRVVVR
ncbi:MAG: T9SS type A sorting domain-containing protein, partial [Bacteroidota bacterium]